jgi:hypothetical protein
MKPRELAGRRFGRLIAVEVCGVKNNVRVWRCTCDCGNQCEVDQNHLTTNRTKSCGCYRKERNTTHGMSGSPEWSSYDHAKQRCKPNHCKHEHYFDRGITFNFTSFEQFYAEVGPKPTPKHSLDRWPNNDGPYGPGNVRWATKSQQERNRRCDNCLALKERIKILELQLAEAKVQLVEKEI